MNSIQVKNLEGKPVSGATAVCVSPETPAVLKGFTLEGGGERLQTDADGRLMLHLTEQNAFIVIANEHGFGLAPGYDLSRNPNMVVKPWGRIEGVRTNCGRPMANRRLRFRLGWREVGSHEITQSLRIPMETTTDSQGSRNGHRYFRSPGMPHGSMVSSACSRAGQTGNHNIC
jgi:hypothetical protein